MRVHSVYACLQLIASREELSRRCVSRFRLEAFWEMAIAYSTSADPMRAAA